MTLKPCVVCGEPSQGSRCADHQPKDQRREHRRDVKTASWIRLSERARKLQPFCTLCSSTKNLQADHSPRAWSRMKLKKPLRLCDVTVLCSVCNVRAGSSRPGSPRFKLWAEVDGDVSAKTPDWTVQTWGDSPPQAASRPAGKPQKPLYTPQGYTVGGGEA